MLCCFLSGQVLFVSSISDLNKTNVEGYKNNCVYECFFFPPQDVINVVGGLGVLLPLLEQICEAEPGCNGSQDISDLLGPELTSSRGPAAMLLPLNKSAGQVMFGSDIQIYSMIFLVRCMLDAVIVSSWKGLFT